MKTIELFCGTKSFSKVAGQLKHETFTVDINPSVKPDMVADISTLTAKDFPYRPDMLWCSPPCEAFSVASIGHHWRRDKTPKSATAWQSLNLVRRMISLIEELNPTWFFIENPRGMLRKQILMHQFDRRTITYCQYGDARMKPTDIWTNAYWWNYRSPCKNGAPCHERAPRGSKSGTQGQQNAQARGAIPAALFEEIFIQESAFRQMTKVA
jgi:site-specific DNA-cytosine methylase